MVRLKLANHWDSLRHSRDGEQRQAQSNWTNVPVSLRLWDERSSLMDDRVSLPLRRTEGPE
jgi:hypothetical protein